MSVITPDYLRLSVTDRCNLRCDYCRGNFIPVNREQVLTLEELFRVAELFAGAGLTKLRLTGGEPLVRKGIVGLIRKIHGAGCYEEISLTTNGILLSGMAADLRAAGIRRLNISLDSLDPDEFKILTGGTLDKTLAGITAACDAAFAAIKINVVIWKPFTDRELMQWLDFAGHHGVSIRFIEQMKVSDDAAPARFIPARLILEQLQRLKPLAPGPAGMEPVSVPGFGPAFYFRVKGTGINVGFIEAMNRHQCGSCNRVRVSALGELRYCLFQPQGIDLRRLLQSEPDNDILLARLKDLLGGKQDYRRAGDRAILQPMSCLGG